jgi:hypothetical protein
MVEKARARAALDDWEWSNLRRVLHTVADSIWPRPIDWVRKGIRGLSLNDYTALAARGYEIGSISAPRLKRIAELIARKEMNIGDRVLDQDLVYQCALLSKYATLADARRRRRQAAAQLRPYRRKFTDLELLMRVDQLTKEGKRRSMRGILAREFGVTRTAIRNRLLALKNKRET